MLLPVVLKKRIIAIYGEEKGNTVFAGWEKSRIGSFRINTLAYPNIGIDEIPEDIATELWEKNIIITRFSPLPHTYTYSRDDEYALKWTQTFYQGKIYIQGIASMLPVNALWVEKNHHVLDVCAAPGSKTTQMAASMENIGSIIAIEQNAIRMDKLQYNIWLQWARCIETVKSEAIKYLSTYSWNSFDAILLDAPCSAEGRIQVSNEKTFGFWSIENIRKKAELQYALLTEACKHLKSNGVIVYATCTLAPEENEAIIDQLLTSFPERYILEEVWFSGIESIPWILSFGGKTYHNEIEKTLRVLPTEYTEGFYIAKIRKL